LPINFRYAGLEFQAKGSQAVGQIERQTGSRINRETYMGTVGLTDRDR